MVGVKRQRSVSSSSNSGTSSSGGTSSSDSDDYSYSCSSTSSGWDEPDTTVVNFSFNSVMFGDDGDDSDDDVYQTNGKCKSRVSKAMRSPCCKAGCKQRLALRMVMCLVASFWSLTKGGQDALLWSIQHPVWSPGSPGDDECSDDDSCDSDPPVQKLSWHIEGGGLVCLFKHVV